MSNRTWYRTPPGRLAAGLLFGLMAAIGCTSSPSSSSVQAGGTIAIALSDGELSG